MSWLGCGVQLSCIVLYFLMHSVNGQTTTVKNVATTKSLQSATTETTSKPATTVKIGKTITTKATPTTGTKTSATLAARTVSTLITTQIVTPVSSVKTTKTATTAKATPSEKSTTTIKTTKTTSPTATTKTTIVATKTTETTVAETTTSTETVQRDNPVTTAPTLQTTTPIQATPLPTPNNVNPYQLVQNCRSVDPDFVSKLERGLPNDDRFKRFLRCIYVKKNAMTESGEINNQVIMTFLLRRLRSARLAQSVFQRCVRKADSPENTAYSITVCLRDNGVNVFVRGRRRD